jgi:hypothetical protein
MRREALAFYAMPFAPICRPHRAHHKRYRTRMLCASVSDLRASVFGLWTLVLDDK